MPITKKLEEIAEAIAGDRQALLDATSGLSEAQLDYSSEEGQWSINDILHHLALADEANVKLVSIAVKKAEEMGLPPNGAPEESALDCLDALKESLGVKNQAPDRVAPRSRVPARESLARLVASREKLVGSLERLSQYDLSQLVFPHPFLGDLNLYQWLLLGGRHENRHVKQISKIKSQDGFPPANN